MIFSELRIILTKFIKIKNYIKHDVIMLIRIVEVLFFFVFNQRIDIKI